MSHIGDRVKYFNLQAFKLDRHGSKKPWWP